MQKKLMVIVLLVICSFTLMACGDAKPKEETTDNENHETKKDANQTETEDEIKINIPEDLIVDADADPIEIKDQMGLKMGDTGYAGKYFEDGVLAITLNEVEKTQAISESSVLDGEKFYLIGDFTFENVSSEAVEIIRPDAVKASDEAAVLNDEFGNGDLLGVGHGLGGSFLNDENKIPDGTPVNTVMVEPGETINQKISITMRDSTDEYMIVFGFFDGNNKYYRNKIAWVFDAAELEK